MSRADVVRQLTVEQGISEYVFDYYRDVHHYETDSPESLMDIGERFGQRLEQLRIKDFMTRQLIIVSPMASLTELGEIFFDHHIHRVPVVANERLDGIVTTLDLVRLFADGRVTVVD